MTTKGQEWVKKFSRNSVPMLGGESQNEIEGGLFFVLLFQDCFHYLRFLDTLYEFWNGFFFCFCKKKVIGILTRIALNL